MSYNSQMEDQDLNESFESNHSYIEDAEFLEREELPQGYAKEAGVSRKGCSTKMAVAGIVALAGVVGSMAIGAYPDTLSQIKGSAWLPTPLSGVSSTVDLDDASFPEYLNFIAQYGKTHQTESEFYSRYEVFKDNYKKIEEHNKIQDSGFELGINKFADLTEEEFLSQVTGGLRVPPAKTEKMKNWVIPEKDSSEIAQNVEGRLLSSFPDYQPSHVDWYKRGYVTQPLNQGHCGACWAFSTAAAVESLAMIAGVNEQLERYSIQQLIDCDDTLNFACAGGWMYQGFMYVSKYGILDNNDYRHYDMEKRACQVTRDHLEDNGAMRDIGYVEHDGRTNEELKELLNVQPLSVSVYTTGMYQAYKSGIMTEDFLHCSYPDREVNHGVLLVGYGKVSPTDYVRGRCKEYWIVRNSWGPDWGEEGFFRLCADVTDKKKTPAGTCLINRYTVWPTMDMDDIDPNFQI